MSKSQQWSDIDINWISGTCLLAGLALGKGEGTALPPEVFRQDVILSMNSKVPPLVLAKTES